MIKSEKNRDWNGTKAALEDCKSESPYREELIMHKMLFLTAIGILSKQLFGLVLNVKNRLF